MGIGYSTAHHGGSANPGLHPPYGNNTTTTPVTNIDETQAQDGVPTSNVVAGPLQPHPGRATASSSSASPLSSSPPANNNPAAPVADSAAITATTTTTTTTTTTAPIDLYEAMGANFRYFSAVNGAHRIPEMAKPLDESDNNNNNNISSSSSSTGSDQQARTKSAVVASSAATSITSSSPPKNPTSVQTRRPITKWQKGELIGAGSFGKVYLGMNCETGELIAVKEVTFIGTAANIMEQVSSLQQEIELLKNLDHENIVRYLGVERVGNSLNIFLEYVPGGSIASLVSKFGRLKEMVIRKFTKQILEGLLYLHENRIIHRDIKGANVLVDVNGSIKLTDFGASKQIADIMTITDGFKSLKGTPFWMAPEVIMQTGHGRAADIWSVGCTVLEMATGRPPWSDFQSQVTALLHIAHTSEPPPIPDDLSSEAKDFLLRCFERNPKLRATAHELLKHPFITEELDIREQPHRPPVITGTTPPLSPASALGFPNAERSRYGEPRGFGDAPSRIAKQDGNSNFNFHNTATAAGLLNAKDTRTQHNMSAFRADLSPNSKPSSARPQTQLPNIPTRPNRTPLKPGNQETILTASPLDRQGANTSSTQHRIESIPEPNLVEEPDFSDNEDDDDDDDDDDKTKTPISTTPPTTTTTHSEQPRLPPINPPSNLSRQMESGQSSNTTTADDESTDMSPSSQEKAIKNFLRTKSKRDGLQLMTDDMLTVFRTRLGRFADTPTAASTSTSTSTRDPADNFETLAFSKDRMERSSPESQMMILPRRGRLNNVPRDYSPDRGEQHSSTIMPPLRDDDIERLSQYPALAKQKQHHQQQQQIQQSRLLKSSSLNSNMPQQQQQQQQRSVPPHLLDHSSRSAGNLVTPVSSNLESRMEASSRSHPASGESDRLSTSPTTTPVSMNPNLSET